ncbi:hypothetical protein ACP4OV_003803 [Aristida adscensionis]
MGAAAAQGERQKAQFGNSRGDERVDCRPEKRARASASPVNLPPVVVGTAPALAPTIFF